MKTYEEAISGLRKYMPEHAAVIDRENARLRAAIEAMPTCRCGMSTDEQCKLASENAKLREDKTRLDFLESLPFGIDIIAHGEVGKSDSVPGLRAQIDEFIRRNT